MSSYEILMKNKLVVYEATPNYGVITEKSITLDDCQIFKEFLIGYRLYKIKCWTEKNVGILGIQLSYKDRETNDEIISINKHRPDDLTFQEFILDPLELVTSLTIWKNEILNGFEIYTNKKRIKRFGYDDGEKIIPEEFEDYNLNIIMGFFFTYEPEPIKGISSMGCYYLNRKLFSLILYSGMLYLRIKLKDEKFKNEIKNRLSEMDITDKALYYTCLLPSNQFYGIIKYTLS